MPELIIPSLFLSAFVQLLLVRYAWGRRREPAGLPLAILSVIGLFWALSYGINLASSDSLAKIVLMQIRYSLTVFIPPITLWLVCVHLDRSYLLSRKRITALLFVPALTISLIWTSPYHHLFRYAFSIQQVGPLQVLTWQNGPGLWLALIYADVLFVASIILLLRSWPGASQIKRRQTAFMLVALAIPLLSDTLFNLGISPIPSLNFTPLLFIFTWTLISYAIFYYRWLEIVPQARIALVDFLPAGMLVLDPQGRVADINLLAQNLLGVSSAMIGQPARQVLARFSPSILDQPDFDHPRQEVIRLHSSGAVEYYDIEITPLKDKAGSLTGQLIMFFDVTERKTKELRLLQFSQAVDQSPTSVVITDQQGKIEYVNPHFTTLTGYTLQEALGQRTSILKSGQTPDAVYKEMWQTILAGQIWRGEFLNKKKNGELYWEKAIIGPVKDDTGSIINFIAVKEDITAQKAAEDALRRSEADLRLTNVELEQRITQIKALEDELREQAIRDPLTGLYNRRFLNEFIENEILRVERSSQPLSVILLDIDHFKDINDTFGHQAGDDYLKLLANLLHNHARRSDIACRYGGEEFLLVLPGTPLDVALRRAEEIRLSLSASTITYKHAEIRATISLGVACYPQHGANSAEILQAADGALYRSKRKGRNQVTSWEKDIHR